MRVGITVVLGLLIFGVVSVAVEDSSTAVGKSKPAQQPYWADNNCGHPRGSDDAKRLAKQYWSKPYGPTKKNRRIWQGVRRCAKTPWHADVRFPRIWKSYKQSLAHHRYVKRLQLGCKNSPTSAVVKCIKLASIHYSYSLSTLYRVASCESHLNPYAQNPSGASGLFQFMPSTWGTTPYSKKSIWSAKWQSLAAAWMMKVGRKGEWVCQ